MKAVGMPNDMYEDLCIGDQFAFSLTFGHDTEKFSNHAIVKEIPHY